MVTAFNGEPTVLLGMSEDSEVSQAEADRIRNLGYRVLVAHSPEGLLEHIGVIPEEDPRRTTLRIPRAILMEIDLGCPGSGDPSPAHAVHSEIEALVRQGSLDYLAVSSDLSAVSSAAAMQIPAAARPSDAYSAFFARLTSD